MKTLQHLLAIIALFCLSVYATNAPGLYMRPELWESTCNAGMLPGKISALSTPQGAGICVTAAQDGDWQGFALKLPEPVDLSKIEKISFDFEQNCYGAMGNMALQLISPAGGGFLATPQFNSAGWRHVSVPISAQALQGLGQSSATLGPINKIVITLFQNFNKKDRHLAIANLVFHDKVAGDHPLPVVSYKHLAPPTSGDGDRTWLTDGKIDKARQAYFREYSDNPDICFDLGSPCRITKFILAAVAVPSQNASAVELHTSFDNKKWHLAKHIPATNNGTEPVPYSISADKLAICGRYVRVKVLRNRTDFQVRIAEITFEGHEATKDELAAATEEHYDLGPAMPELNDDNYLQLKGPDGESLWISRKNGVAVAYEKDGRRIAERIFSRYELSNGKQSVKANAYKDMVKNITQADDGTWQIVTINPAIPNVTFTHAYSWIDGTLNISLAFTSKRTDKKILFTATEVVIPKELRRHGLYESWGAGHDLQHKFAEEVTLELPADTGSVMVFEQPALPLTLLHTRYKYNSRYIQIGSGTVTVAGFGDKRTYFTPTGWIVGDGLFALTKTGCTGQIESRLLVAKGDLTAANDQYLALPEVQDFRSAIHRPAWLKDIRFFHNGPGWDGPWGNNMLRNMDYNSKMIREGWIQSSADYVSFPWGDFSTNEYATIMRGGRRKNADVVASLKKMKEETRCRFAMYTWLWSVSHNSPIYKEHPDWFVTYNADGKISSFFPGWATNFYRIISIPEHRKRVVEDILHVEEFYNCDTWYLDGGGSPSCIDWPTMRIDEPDAWDQTLLEIRNKLQAKNPDHTVFFNHPENPIGDYGFFESFGGVMTTNWRDGATWMYKFKLWQRNDPLRSPLYIYWLSGVDHAMRHYAIGTGLGLTFYTCNLRPEVSYMGAQQQSRWGRLVDANLQPNWRYQPDEKFEGMTLTCGNGSWVFVRSHEEKTTTKTVSASTAPLGLTDPDKPIYSWSMPIKHFSRHKGLLSEGEREADYRSSRWQSDFVVTTRFMNKSPHSSRISAKITLAPDEGILWAMTQSPALVYSVDGLRNQLWLSETMGVKVEGTMNTNTVHLTVNSERKEAEVVSLLPEGKCVDSVTINGKTATFDTIVLDGTPLAVIPVRQGESQVEIALADAIPFNGIVSLTVTPAAPGQYLKLNIKAPGDVRIASSIYFNNDMVWSGEVKAGTKEIRLPAGVTGGTYKAVVYDLSGNAMADATFDLAAGTPKYPNFQPAELLPQNDEKKELTSAHTDKGYTLFGTAKTETPDCGSMSFDPAKGSITLITADCPRTRWYLMAGAYELEAKRYMKIRLEGNFGKHNREDDITGIDGLGTNYDMPNVCFGLNFDFATGTKDARTYTTRTLGGLGIAWENRSTADPTNWGTGKLANVINIISNFGAERNDSEELWLDLQEVGAPTDWNGMLWFGPIYQSGSPARQLTVTILECSDFLPENAKLRKVHPLKDTRTKIEQKIIKPPMVKKTPVIDGKADEPEWKTAPVLNSLSMLYTPVVEAPPTEFRMLRDQKYLYVLATMTHPGNAFCKEYAQDPWFCDNVEVWLGRRNGIEGELQFIFATNGKTYSKRRKTSGAGAAQEDLPVPKHKIIINGNKAVFEIAIPLEYLGTGANVTGFNLCRAVRQDGNITGYTLAPGRSYRNFEYYAIDWKL